MKKLVLVVSFLFCEALFAQEVPCGEPSVITSLNSSTYISCLKVSTRNLSPGKVLDGNLLKHHRSIAYFCDVQDPVFLTKTTVTINPYESVVIQREFYCED